MWDLSGMAEAEKTPQWGPALEAGRMRAPLGRGPALLPFP